MHLMAAALLPPTNTSLRASPQTTQSLIEATLDNITKLNRPGQDGYATVWDGNKYVQCRRLPDRGLRCEAAGALMQSSLERVLSPERAARLIAVGVLIRASATMCKFFRPIRHRASSPTRLFAYFAKPMTPTSLTWRSKAPGFGASRAHRAMGRAKIWPASSTMHRPWLRRRSTPAPTNPRQIWDHAFRPAPPRS